MSIASVDVIVTSPGRNFVTLKVTTSDGIVGWGDATLNGRELSVASYLSDHLASMLIGRDEDRIEDTWQYLYRGAYWRRGPVTMAAIAAVDMALWDIKAKKAGMPLYQLLGGASRDGVRVYAHASGTDFAALSNAITGYRELGFTAVRVQTGVPAWGRSTVSRPPVRVCATTTNRPSARATARPRSSGTPASTSPTCPAFSRRSGRSSAPTCASCTTATTA